MTCAGRHEPIRIAFAVLEDMCRLLLGSRDHAHICCGMFAMLACVLLRRRLSSCTQKLVVTVTCIRAHAML